MKLKNVLAVTDICLFVCSICSFVRLFVCLLIVSWIVGLFVCLLAA